VYPCGAAMRAAVDRMVRCFYSASRKRIVIPAPKLMTSIADSVPPLGTDRLYARMPKCQALRTGLPA